MTDKMISALIRRESFFVCALFYQCTSSFLWDVINLFGTWDWYLYKSIHNCFKIAIIHL